MITHLQAGTEKALNLLVLPVIVTSLAIFVLEAVP